MAALLPDTSAMRRMKKCEGCLQQAETSGEIASGIFCASWPQRINSISLFTYVAMLKSLN